MTHTPHFLTYCTALMIALSTPYMAFAQTSDQAPENAADAQPQDGFYVKETFGAWDQICLKTPEETEPCSLRQVINGPSGTPIAEINISRLPPGQEAPAVGSMLVPLETELTSGLRLTIDGTPERTYPYAVCIEAGCITNIGLTAEELEAMKKGNAITVKIVAAINPSNPIVSQISLDGFSKAYEALSKAAPLNIGG